MKVQSSNNKPLLHKNYFVTIGPLIASLLTILLGHLIGWSTSDHFGDSTTIKSIVGMIILTVPFTACAYIVGFLPALLTREIFSYLVNQYLNSHPTISQIRFLSYGLISVLFWLILPFYFSFTIEIQALLFISLPIFSILILSTLSCTWLEWRYYKSLSAA